MLAMHSANVRSFMMWHEEWEEWVPRDSCYHPETAIWVRLLEQLVDPDVIAPIIHDYNRGLIMDYRTNLTLHYLHDPAAPLRAASIMRSMKHGGIPDLCQIAELWFRVNRDNSLSMEQKDHVKEIQLARLTATGMSAGEVMAVHICLINCNDELRHCHPPWIRTPYSPWYVHEFNTPISYAPLH